MKKKKTPEQPAKSTPQSLLQRYGRYWLILPVLLGVFWLLKPANGSIPDFDGRMAFGLLEKQCAFGPRVPGSSEHQACGDFLVNELQRFADKVSEQQFSYRDRKRAHKVWPGRNILASFNLHPKQNFRILLCAHWDSRPFADQDGDLARQNQPVPGANDGASGVAVLLEIARILQSNPLPFGVDIVLFDLEDLGDHGASEAADSLNPFCIGSEYFVRNNPNYRPAYGILLDMIGDADLQIKKEGFSQVNAPLLVQQVWSAAAKAGASAFVPEVGEAIMDDHYHFLKKNIPVIDLIDFEYTHWHTSEDTPDKCSEASLQQVGNTLVQWLYGTLATRVN